MSLLDWNSIENSRHGITDSLKVQYKFNPLRWNKLKLRRTEGENRNCKLCFELFILIITFLIVKILQIELLEKINGTYFSEN